METRPALLGIYVPFLFGVALAFLLVVVLDVVVALAFLLVVVLDVVAFELDAEDLLVVVLVTSVVALLVALGVPLDLLLAVPVEVAPAEVLPDMLDDAADEVGFIEPVGGRFVRICCVRNAKRPCRSGLGKKVRTVTYKLKHPQPSFVYRHPG